MIMIRFKQNRTIFLFAYTLVFSGLLVCIGGNTGMAQEIETVDEAVAWLEKTSTRLIRESRRDMPNGISAFPPQVGIGYEAFWLRDYAYMLEGNISAFTDQELKDACRFFVDGIREDGAGVDCIKYDGTPIYMPGYGSMGTNPVTDGSPFTVEVAYYTYRKTQDKQLLLDIVDRLILTMNACPRNPANGLVHIDSETEWDRCPYGFTDTVRKKGDVFFSSLLFVRASRYLSELLDVFGRTDESQAWLKEAEQVQASILSTFWDEEQSLFRAATVQCREPDIWGSAFAVFLGIATKNQAIKIAEYFAHHYDEIVDKGQIRHTPGGVYWEVAGTRDQYQNGAYWATPAGWFVYTLDLADSELADHTILDLVRDMKQRNCPEWVFGNHAQLPGYNASASLPLAGIKTLLAHRKSAQ